MVSQVVIGTMDVVKRLFWHNNFKDPPLKIIVFYNVDQILRKDFGGSRYVMEYVNPECQVLLVSSSINDRVKEFSEIIKAERPYNRLFGNQEELTLYTAKHYKIVLETDKGAFIRDRLASTHLEMLIFVKPGEEESMRTSIIVDSRKRGYRGCISILRSGSDPLVAFDRFQTGGHKILITSQRDLDWRFLDSKVSLVVHTVPPRVPSDFPSSSLSGSPGWYGPTYGPTDYK